ncbi:MAG: lysozyme [Sphingomonas sp.]|nr:lysozyme [Sphingomonas sp.]
MTTADRIAKALRGIAPQGKLFAEDVPLIDQLAVNWDARPASAVPAPVGGGPPGLGPTEKAVAIIKEFEGLHKLRPDGRVEAYPDPATGGAPWTIGYGATGSDVWRGTIWTRAQAEARLVADVNRFASGVADLVGGAATARHEFDAMVSLAFNIGLGNFGRSTLLKKHRAGDKAGAAAEFAKWNKAAGKVMAGLTRRRAAEARLYKGQT